MKKHAILSSLVFLLFCGSANASSVISAFENDDQGYDFLTNTRFVPSGYGGLNSMNRYFAPDWSNKNNLCEIWDNTYICNLHGIESQIFNTYNSDDQSLAVLGFDHIVTVHPAVVPIPTALLLFGSGLLGLIGFRRNHQPVDLA